MTDAGLPQIGTVMFVDDEEVDQMLYGRIVERSNHVDRIISFFEPQKALTYLRDANKARPDLILLDINMPGMDGFEFLQVLEREFQTDALPKIVMLTTSFDAEDEARAKQSALVSGYKKKPLTDAMLNDIRMTMAE